MPRPSRCWRCAGAPAQLSRLAWHLGNRHLPAQLEAERILIREDHVIAAMLEGLGARLRRVHEAFMPELGAYAAQDGHGHRHHGDEEHEHTDA
jgi:urease accessory protein